jgi:hypothetical protein
MLQELSLNPRVFFADWKREQPVGQSDHDKEEAVRRRAYELWLEEGKAHGRDREHWSRAKEEIAKAQEQGKTQPPNGNKNAQVTPTNASATESASPSGSPSPPRSAPSRTAAPARTAPKAPPPRGAKR